MLQADEKGFGFKSADGNVAIRFGGQIKADAGFFLNDDAKAFTDSFSISSARPVITGTVFRDFDFTLSGEFGGSSPSLVDAFLEWKYWPGFKVRAGRFKQPFGLERLQSDVNNWFTTLGLPSQLVPGRDVGLQISGDLIDGVFNYAVSVANGVADGTSALADNNDAKDVTGRLWLQPFKKTDVDALQGLSVGVAASYGWQNGQTNSANLASYKTACGNTFFSYQTGSTNGAYASGDRIRLSPQFTYFYGRLGLLGEYVISSQEVQRGARSANLQTRAWQIAGAFALTDDQPSFRGLVPKKPFSLKDGQWGAWELVARVGQLETDDGVYRGTSATRFANPATQAADATAWGVGLNWYWNRNARWFFDYDQTSFNRGATTGNRPDEYFVSTRFQVAY